MAVSELEKYADIMIRNIKMLSRIVREVSCKGVLVFRLR